MSIGTTPYTACFRHIRGFLCGFFRLPLSRLNVYFPGDWNYGCNQRHSQGAHFELYKSLRELCPFCRLAYFGLHPFGTHAFFAYALLSRPRFSLPHSLAFMHLPLVFCVFAFRVFAFSLPPFACSVFAFFSNCVRTSPAFCKPYLPPLLHSIMRMALNRSTYCGFPLRPVFGSYFIFGICPGFDLLPGLASTMGGIPTHFASPRLGSLPGLARIRFEIIFRHIRLCTRPCFRLRLPGFALIGYHPSLLFRMIRPALQVLLALPGCLTSCLPWYCPIAPLCPVLQYPSPALPGLALCDPTWFCFA